MSLSLLLVREERWRRKGAVESGTRRVGTATAARRSSGAAGQLGEEEEERRKGGGGVRDGKGGDGRGGEEE